MAIAELRLSFVRSSLHQKNERACQSISVRKSHASYHAMGISSFLLEDSEVSWGVGFH